MPGVATRFRLGKLTTPFTAVAVAPVRVPAPDTVTAMEVVLSETTGFPNASSNLITASKLSPVAIVVGDAGGAFCQAKTDASFAVIAKFVEVAEVRLDALNAIL